MAVRTKEQKSHPVKLPTGEKQWATVEATLFWGEGVVTQKEIMGKLPLSYLLQSVKHMWPFVCVATLHVAGGRAHPPGSPLSFQQVFTMENYSRDIWTCPPFHTCGLSRETLPLVLAGLFRTDLPTTGPEDQWFSHRQIQSKSALSDCPIMEWLVGHPGFLTSGLFLYIFSQSQVVPSSHIGLTTSMTFAEKSPSLEQSTSPSQATWHLFFFLHMSSWCISLWCLLYDTHCQCEKGLCLLFHWD